MTIQLRWMVSQELQERCSPRCGAEAGPCEKTIFGHYRENVEREEVEKSPSACPSDVHRLLKTAESMIRNILGQNHRDARLIESNIVLHLSRRGFHGFESCTIKTKGMLLYRPNDGKHPHLMMEIFETQICFCSADPRGYDKNLFYDHPFILLQAKCDSSFETCTMAESAESFSTIIPYDYGVIAPSLRLRRSFNSFCYHISLSYLTNR